MCPPSHGVWGGGRRVAGGGRGQFTPNRLGRPPPSRHPKRRRATSPSELGEGAGLDEPSSMYLRLLPRSRGKLPRVASNVPSLARSAGEVADESSRRSEGAAHASRVGRARSPRESRPMCPPSHGVWGGGRRVAGGGRGQFTPNRPGRPPPSRHPKRRRATSPSEASWGRARECASLGASVARGVTPR